MTESAHFQILVAVIGAAAALLGSLVGATTTFLTLLSQQRHSDRKENAAFFRKTAIDLIWKMRTRSMLFSAALSSVGEQADELHSQLLRGGTLPEIALTADVYFPELHSKYEALVAADGQLVKFVEAGRGLERLSGEEVKARLGALESYADLANVVNLELIATARRYSPRKPQALT